MLLARDKSISSLKSNCGFSLIELIIIILVLSALAVFAVPRLNPDGFREPIYAREVFNAFQYSQNLARSSGCEVQVSVAASGAFSVNYRSGTTSSSCGSGAGFGVPVPTPGGSGPYQGSPNENLGLSGLTIAFDSLGQPTPNGGSLAIGGRTIIIEPGTGYVHW